MKIERISSNGCYFQNLLEMWRQIHLTIALKTNDLVHEESMSGLAGLDQIPDKNVSGLESPPDYRIRISGLNPDYLRLPR